MTFVLPFSRGGRLRKPVCDCGENLTIEKLVELFERNFDGVGRSAAHREAHHFGVVLRQWIRRRADKTRHSLDRKFLDAIGDLLVPLLRRPIFPGTIDGFRFHNRVLAQELRQARILHHRENLSQQMTREPLRARETDLRTSDEAHNHQVRPAIRTPTDKLQMTAAIFRARAPGAATAIFSLSVVFQKGSFQSGRGSFAIRSISSRFFRRLAIARSRAAKKFRLHTFLGISFSASIFEKPTAMRPFLSATTSRTCTMIAISITGQDLAAAEFPARRPATGFSASRGSARRTSRRNTKPFRLFPKSRRATSDRATSAPCSRLFARLRTSRCRTSRSRFRSTVSPVARDPMTDPENGCL